jgi:hypothetical protein
MDLLTKGYCTYDGFLILGMCPSDLPHIPDIFCSRDPPYSQEYRDYELSLENDTPQQRSMAWSLTTRFHSNHWRSPLPSPRCGSKNSL